MRSLSALRVRTLLALWMATAPWLTACNDILDIRPPSEQIRDAGREEQGSGSVPLRPTTQDASAEEDDDAGRP